MVENKLLLWWGSLTLPFFIQSTPPVWGEGSITRKMQQNPELQIVKEQCDALTQEQRGAASSYLAYKRLHATDPRAKGDRVAGSLCCIFTFPFTLINCITMGLLSCCVRGKDND